MTIETHCFNITPLRIHRRNFLSLKLSSRCSNLDSYQILLPIRTHEYSHYERAVRIVHALHGFLSCSVLLVDISILVNITSGEFFYEMPLSIIEIHIPETIYRAFFRITVKRLNNSIVLIASQARKPSII